MELFTRLMDAGADGSAGWRGCYGRTLLGAAAYGKSEEMVLALLKAGAKDDVNLKFGYNQGSALHVAASYGAERASNALMLAGANQNVLDVYKQSPLHLAAEAGHDSVVNTLMLQGADPTSRREYGDLTALHLAAAMGHALCVSKLVVGGADKNSQNRYGYSPLHVAVMENRLGAVEELMSAGANVDVRDTAGWSPLDLAAKEGHVGVLTPFLWHGSSVKACDANGYTALHRATRQYHDNGDMIRVLLEAGADIEAKTTVDGSTPLHLAASRRNAESGTIRAVLGGGANVNARDAVDSTPLHDACGRSCAGAVELLLRSGADETLVNHDGETGGDLVINRQQNGGNNNGRKAEDQRIRCMLAGAPADRCWRRRGWLVLARSCPTKVQLAHESNGGGGGGGNNGSSAKMAKASNDGSDSGRHETADLERLVGRVVGLDVEGVFRLVMGFL